MSAFAGRRWPKAGQASPRPVGIRKDIMPRHTGFLKSPQRSTTDQSWKGRSFWSLKRLFSGKLSRNQDSVSKHCRKRHELKVNQHVCCGNHHIDKVLATHHPGQPKSNQIKSSSNPFPQQNFALCAKFRWLLETRWQWEPSWSVYHIFFAANEEAWQVCLASSWVKVTGRRKQLVVWLSRTVTICSLSMKRHSPGAETSTLQSLPWQPHLKSPPTWAG